LGSNEIDADVLMVIHGVALILAVVGILLMIIFTSDTHRSTLYKTKGSTKQFWQRYFTDGDDVPLDYTYTTHDEGKLSDVVIAHPYYFVEAKEKVKQWILGMKVTDELFSSGIVPKGVEKSKGKASERPSKSSSTATRTSMTRRATSSSTHRMAFGIQNKSKIDSLLNMKKTFFMKLVLITHVNKLLLDVAELKERLEQKRESKQKTKTAEEAAKLPLETAPIKNKRGDDENQAQMLQRVIAEKDKVLNTINERDSTIAALR